MIFSTEFSPLVIEESDQDYVKLRLKDTSSYLMNPGQPMLPKVVKTFELPFGVKNVDVEIIPHNVYEYEIKQEIRPAPEPMPLTTTVKNIVIEENFFLIAAKQEIGVDFEAMTTSTSNFVERNKLLIATIED